MRRRFRRFIKETAMADKSTKEIKPSRIQRYWRETIGELRKVTWPTNQEAWRLTKIVLYVMIAMALFLGILDFVFSNIITAILT
jgi:preprotein translocase subunit SecE